MSVNSFLQRKAFTLIELLIVIVIIGVVYTLSISNFERLTEKEAPQTIATLKEYLNDMNHTKSAKILCLDDCSSCDIYIDDNKTDMKLEDFLDDSVKTYRYEFSYGYVEVEQDVFFNVEGMEEDVCFSYEIEKNGVGDQVLVEFKEKYYDLSTYFENTVVYNSLEEAQEIKEDLQSEVK